MCACMYVCIHKLHTRKGVCKKNDEFNGYKCRY